MASWRTPFLLGWIFFPSLYYQAKRITSAFTKDELTKAKIAEKSVSIVQAVMASTVGVIIVSSCTGDIMYDRHWLVESYVIFATPYELFDIYAMYVVFTAGKSQQQSNKLKSQILEFLKSHPAMILHHLVLIFLFGPVVLFFRNGKGDFFVGCFCFVEMANPFMHFRAILKQIGLENTRLGIANGLLLLVTFCVCRLLLFPFMYGIYGRTRNLSLWEVPFHIPLKCNVGCAVLLAFQLYWFYLIIGAAKRTIKKLR
ncbi:TLC domain-containing protein 3A-like [Ptychodera flava]|uniref:TLC domain-containing protein 3A-like n=1 Tax=Ptychodera flava TaxID=63121 RepID=UPI003969FB6C